MEETPKTYDEEISLRDLILKMRSFAQEVLRHWQIPAFVLPLLSLPGI